MNLLFIHDCPFFQDGDIYYNAGGLPASVWTNNYLPYFSSVTVVGRQSYDIKDKAVVSSSNNGKIQFNLIPEYSTVFNFCINYFTIKEKIKDAIGKADFVIIRLPSQLGFIAAKILAKSYKPFLVEVVENAFETYWYYPSFIGKCCAHYFNIKTIRIMKYAPYAVYVARKLKKDYPAYENTAIISNVILEKILRQDQMQLSRFHSVDFKVGIIGALNLKYKGQTVLLKAISTLDDAIKRHITLYFVGSGNYDRIIKKAEKLRLVENIKFIGPLPHEEIFNLLSTLSLYVHPSFKEGLPRALLEAMSMGCPVLGSTNGGIPEVVKSEYLHKPGDYKTLSRQIQNFYEDRALLEREAFTSLELVEPYLKENLDKKRNDFYKKLVNKIIK